MGCVLEAFPEKSKIDLNQKTVKVVQKSSLSQLLNIKYTSGFL